MNTNNIFRKFATGISNLVGRPFAFFFAVTIIITWAALGPMFGFSDTWQLVINTGTTIITFLIVFLIQNTQNRDSKAIHIKLDELISSIKGARNTFINLEELPDEEIEDLHKQFQSLHEKYSLELERRVNLKGGKKVKK